MILSYCDKIVFINTSETNYPWSPTIGLALTVASQNDYRRCKYRRYTIDVSWFLTPVAIPG